MHKDQFTATGPAFDGAGFPRAAFSNNDQSNQTDQDFIHGVNVQGKECGVYGQSVTNNGGRDSLVVGVGVQGVGETFGVIGSGGRGLAGVLGVHNRSGIGVAGTVMRGGTGVVGASFDSLNSPHSNLLQLPESADGSGTGVLGASGSGTGVRGTSKRGDGVTGKTDVDHRSGVFGFNTGAGPGVFGASESGDGVGGDASADNKSGVVGLNHGAGPGVFGGSENGDGVVGNASANNKSGVVGLNQGAGPGVFGGSENGDGVVGAASANNKSGVFGVNSGAGSGILGSSKNGNGVSGVGGIYGASLQGGRAPLRLAPAATKGAPKSGLHQIGEFFVDTQGTLFFCSQTGTPGKWNQVQMVAV